MDDSGSSYFSIVEAAAQIRAGKLSSFDLVRNALDRINTLDTDNKVFIQTSPEEAVSSAKQADIESASGMFRGPLHGLPVAIKDLCDVAGTVTTAGSFAAPPTTSVCDASIVEKLIQAGAIIIGKTNLHELALGGTGVNNSFGTPSNPWGEGRIPGGSSSGSAVAVARDMSIAAIGSDTGGSIRGPAALCGITGLKPSFGRVSRRGVWPLSMNLDHVGPMGRSAIDCGIMLNVMAGYDRLDPYSEPINHEDFTRTVGVGISGRRIGVPRQFFFNDLENDVGQCLDNAIRVLEGMGASLVPLDFEWAEKLSQNNFRMVPVDAAFSNRAILDDADSVKKLGDDVRERLLERGCNVDGRDYSAWLNLKKDLMRRTDELFNSVDVLLTPTVFRTASRIDSDHTDEAKRILTFTAVFNQTGQPSISVPCGFDGNQLPVGMMLSARLFNEAMLIQVASAYQEVTDWHLYRPV